MRSSKNVVLFCVVPNVLRLHIHENHRIQKTLDLRCKRRRKPNPNPSDDSIHLVEPWQTRFNKHSCHPLAKWRGEEASLNHWIGPRFQESFAETHFSSINNTVAPLAHKPAMSSMVPFSNESNKEDGCIERNAEKKGSRQNRTRHCIVRASSGSLRVPALWHSTDNNPHGTGIASNVRWKTSSENSIHTANERRK